MKFAALIAAMILLAGVLAARAETCVASIYSTHDSMQSGSRTASGVRLNDGAMTAAHKSLPFGARVRVTNMRTGRAAEVTITDRGPYVRGRCIDLTLAAGRALGIDGIEPVNVERVQ